MQQKLGWLNLKGVNWNVENKKRILTPDVLPCGVCRIKNDAYFTLLDANDEYYRIYGYTREEADKAGFSTVSYIIYPPDWQRTIETVAAAEKNVGGVFELEVRASTARCDTVDACQGNSRQG